MTFLVSGLIGLLVWRVSRRVSAVVVVASMLCLLVLALPFVADSLLRSLEARIPFGDPIAPGAIIVLGGDQSQTVGGLTPFDPGLLSLARERTAAALARKTNLPILVTGGELNESALPISAIMARSLNEDFGVSVAWTETRARTTWENAEFSAILLKAKDINSAYLVTQGWHMPRAALAFRHFGMKVVPAPTIIQAPPSLKWRSFVPSVSSWNESYFALHEWIGWAYYAWLD